MTEIQNSRATDSEILEIVDSENKVVGKATRSEIHKKGLQHRAVHVFVFNSKGELYVQRRSSLKDRHPLKLDSSAAGHLEPGETYEAAARRELEEELSIKGCVEEVLKIQACWQTDNEHVALYTIFTDSEPKPNPEEIQWGGFISRDNVNMLIEENPDDFVPSFVLLWKEFLRKIS